MNLSGLRNAAEQDVRSDPSRAPRGRRQRFALLDDLGDEKMLWHDEQVDDRERLQVVVHQQQVGIIARGQPLALGPERAVDDAGAEPALLALQLELLAARPAKEIRQRTVIRKCRHPRIAAMRAIRPRADPGFGPGACALRSAGEGGLGSSKPSFMLIP